MRWPKYKMALRVCWENVSKKKSHYDCLRFCCLQCLQAKRNRNKRSNYFPKTIFSSSVSIRREVVVTALWRLWCTVCIRDLDKLNFIYWFDFRLEPIIATVPVASKNTTLFKKYSLPQWPKTIYLASSTLIHIVKWMLLNDVTHLEGKNNTSLGINTVTRK